MERLSVAGAACATRTFENGTTVSARKVEVKRPIPGSVAKHEAAHVVAAGRIVSATIIPSGHAEGKTRPVHLTASSAAAAGAMGYEGFGWDKHLTVNYLGVDWETAKAAARADLSGRGEEMYEVASIIQERSTIGHADVEEARENVKKRNQGIFSIEVEILTPDGQIRTHTTESFKGEIKISDLIDFSPEAKRN